MKPFRTVLLSCALSVSIFAQAQNQEGSQSSSGTITHVQTVLGHVSLLEFREPVVAAAAGSTAFHIERYEDKVLITPSKAGVSTNLFVWTSTRRFNYELDPPAEGAASSLAIDAPTPEPRPVIDVKQQQTQLLVKELLGNGLLRARRVDSSTVKTSKGTANIRVQQLFQNDSTVYIFYTVENLSKQPFRMIQPAIQRLDADHSMISIPSVENYQLGPNLLTHLGPIRSTSLPVEYWQAEQLDVAPGEQKTGVVALEVNRPSPIILQLVFGESLKAILVL